MRTLNRKEWIAVAASLLVIALFVFGDTITSFLSLLSQNTMTNDNSNQSEEVNPRTLPSGLIVEDLTVGTGEEAVANTIVTVHYTGTFVNGTKFDSSLDRGVPFQFVLGAGQVIRGWDEGVVGMKVGGKRKLIIPPQLAYGGAVGHQLQNETLVFEVEVLNVSK
ncbi:MAG: FKBP-type peptidyl-prolyl cis-trans isomerase [Patescibacteria group bacterium]|nr:FKBP-type peptidyl-prolyl cis-trans isomerase [bacterium]MDZ4240694.1 FKBP-type peptidyl-prolyl cis-trans isomerase [Patescibacteria group bacterium]